MTTRFRDGDVTITLDDGLARFVRSALSAAEAQTVRILETAVDEVQASASVDWYSANGVTRRTGKSGDIVTTTTISDKEVRVSVGTTDLAKAKFVHRPGPLSTHAVEITRQEYDAQKAAGGGAARLVFRARTSREEQGITAGLCYRFEISPKASDGKYLLAELIRKPMGRKIKTLIPALGRAIAAKIGGGRG